MQKKLLTLAIFISALTTAAFSLEFTDKATEAKVAASLIEAKNTENTKYPSTGASEDAVVRFTFVAKTDVETAHYDDTLTSHKECSAVVIDSRWLLASQTCMVLDDKVKATYYQGSSCPPSEVTCTVKNRWTEKERLIIDGKYYPVEVNFVANQLVIFARDSALVSKLTSLPKANILATGPKSKLEDFKDLNFFINRKSYVFQAKELQERDIANLCLSTACIEVKYSFWHTDAQAGDPLFVKLANNMEFLVGFNAAQNYTDGNNRKSRNFKVITQKDMQDILAFITKETPAVIPALNKKIVNKITLKQAEYKYE